MKLKKPAIKFDSFRGMYTCVSVERTPGELCFITGNGSTPKAAFEEWQTCGENYLRLTGEAEPSPFIPLPVPSECPRDLHYPCNDVHVEEFLREVYYK